MQLTASLRNDQVKHLRPKSPVLVTPDHSIADVIALLQEKREGCVIICDTSGKAIGIFTERDVLRRVIGEQVDLESPIKGVMSTELATVLDEDPVVHALRQLHQRGLRHLPVVDQSGAPTGIVSVRRVMEYIVEHFPQEVYNLPPDPSPTLANREGA